MENLKLFLENWKNEVKGHYINLANQIINEEMTHKELKEKVGNKDYEIVTNIIYTMRFENGKNLEKVLNFVNKEADKKETDFINKVNKYVGEVIDCKNLRTSISYGIDGIIIGTNGKVKIETIVASGVVQRRHFRILVKKMK